MRRTREAEIVATPGHAGSGPDAVRAPFEAGADASRFDFGHGTHEGKATRRRPPAMAPASRGGWTSIARSSAEPAAPPRLHLTPEHEAAAVQVAARTNGAGTSADPDAAGDAVGRYEARVIAAGAPLGAAGTTNPIEIMAV